MMGGPSAQTCPCSWKQAFTAPTAAATAQECTQAGQTANNAATASFKRRIRPCQPSMLIAVFCLEGAVAAPSAAYGSAVSMQHCARRGVLIVRGVTESSLPWTMKAVCSCSGRSVQSDSNHADTKLVHACQKGCYKASVEHCSDYLPGGSLTYPKRAESRVAAPTAACMRAWACADPLPRPLGSPPPPLMPCLLYPGAV